MQLAIRCISIILFVLRLSLELHAQTGRLKIELTINKDLTSELNRLSFYGDISQGDPDDEKHFYSKEILFEEGKTSAIVDSLKEGSYKVVISGVWSSTIGKHSGRFWLKSARFENVTITNGTQVIKTTYPEDCKYYKDFRNNMCPKCHKNDKVIFIAYGHLFIDPLTGATADLHEAYREPTGCDPILYCKRDDLEF